MKRTTGSGRCTAALRFLKVRIVLRNRFKREPSSTEVLEYLTSDLNDNFPYKVVSAAFRAGEEVRPEFVCLCDRAVKRTDILRKWFVMPFNA